MVVAGDGLHEDAAEAGDGEQDEFDKAEGEEFGEPVGGLGDGQRIVDAGEVGVALAPDQLGGVERGDDVEEQHGAAFDRLQHEVGDGPDVLVRRRGRHSGRCCRAMPAIRITMRPEGNLAQDVARCAGG